MVAWGDGRGSGYHADYLALHPLQPPYSPNYPGYYSGELGQAQTRSIRSYTINTVYMSSVSSTFHAESTVNSFTQL